MPITRFASNPAPSTSLEIPAKGFPFSEQELRNWFRNKHGREASDLEIGEIMEAMTARDDKVELRSGAFGWRVEPAAKKTTEEY